MLPMRVPQPTRFVFWIKRTIASRSRAEISVGRDLVNGCGAKPMSSLSWYGKSYRQTDERRHRNSYPGLPRGAVAIASGAAAGSGIARPAVGVSSLAVADPRAWGVRPPDLR